MIVVYNKVITPSDFKSNGSRIVVYKLFTIMHYAHVKQYPSQSWCKIVFTHNLKLTIDFITLPILTLLIKKYLRHFTLDDYDRHLIV